MQLAIARGCELEELALEDLQAIDPALDQSVYAALDMDRALGARDHFGGTAPAQVRAACERARERIARLVCADAEQLAAPEIDAIAAYLHDEQVRQVEAAARRVSGRFGDRPMPIVALGSGAFIARAVAERLGAGMRAMPWSAAESDVAPAAALAELAAGAC